MRFSLLCRGRRSFFYCGERERMGAMSQRGNRWTRDPQEAQLGRGPSLMAWARWWRERQKDPLGRPAGPGDNKEERVISPLYGVLVQWRNDRWCSYQEGCVCATEAEGVTQEEAVFVVLCNNGDVQ